MRTAIGPSRLVGKAEARRLLAKPGRARQHALGAGIECQGQDRASASGPCALECKRHRAACLRCPGNWRRCRPPARSTRSRDQEFASPWHSSRSAQAARRDRPAASCRAPYPANLSTSRRRPPTLICDARPNTPSPKVTSGTSSLPMFTASGSSGIWSEPDSGGGIPSSGRGLRNTSMRSAASVSMSRRPRNRAAASRRCGRWLCAARCPRGRRS